MRLNLLTQPVNRILIIGFTLIALVPVSVLGVKLYQAAWDDAWREIHEKHRLLALNLTLPIEIYINDHRSMLKLLASSLTDQYGNLDYKQLELRGVERAQRYLKDFKSLVLVDKEGNTRLQIQDGTLNKNTHQLFAKEVPFIYARDKNRWYLSGIQKSPLDGKPTLILAQPVRNAENKVVYVLLGELSIDLIEKLRRNIKFGVKGHSAIVDNFGRVIAHPNPGWMKSMEDLSDWDIVHKMMAGETGVTEFYSSFIKQNMVAGYTSVPKYGWGIMVPQPKSEVEDRVHKLLFSQLAWGLLGLMLAVVSAIALARWITGPINRLAAAAEKLNNNDFEGEIPEMKENMPKEISQLNFAIHGLVSGLQESRVEVTKLNASLKGRVEEATSQLTDANKKLVELVEKDHLTRLSNRRHFESSLKNSLNRRSSDISSLCILLIDIDNFKEINDQYGHAAGDAILVQLSSIMGNAMRNEDLVARYGGDEFVAHMRCNLKIGRTRATEIKDGIDAYRFHWQGEDMHVTVSIGLLYCSLDREVDFQSVLREVDKAMYQAKQKGKNEIMEVMFS
jgi:diguanylate cyclase (GGDEF)-like protein